MSISITRSLLQSASSFARSLDGTMSIASWMSICRASGFATREPFFKITNYDTVHADLPLIEGWSPDLVILDEAQRIKNWSTRVARGISAE